MKKKAVIVIIILLAILATAGYFCFPRFVHGPIYLDYSNSDFQDFMEIDNMAYSRCHLTVINETGQKAYVRISATASLCDRNFLYSQKELTGYTMDMQSEIFPVEPGENELLVYFGAPYGGTYWRGSKMLPWNIRITTVAENDPEIKAVSVEQYYGGEMLLSLADIEAGKTSAEYDIDKDGTPEQLDFCIVSENPEAPISEQKRFLQISFYDDGRLSDTLEIPLLAEELMEVLIYDFGFEDGSLELILQFGAQYAVQFEDKPWETYDESAVSLVRIVNNELFIDVGSIYGSGGYHIDPAEIYTGSLYSISGNRVTIADDTIPPIRVDLAENLNPAY